MPLLDYPADSSENDFFFPVGGCLLDSDHTHVGERALLVHVNFSGEEARESLLELRELASTAGAHVVSTITGMRSAPDPKFFIGSGKADEVKSAVMLHEVDLILVNHELSPAQERNLERYCECRVLDRTGLILDIFAQRARTFEGKLQVELAQLQHLSTRLIRGWTHLERQKGGIGLRGPGETQLETDRRLIRDRIKTIHKRLDKVRSQREQNRRARQRSAIPTVSIVGYTNAGKSTLFNHVTGAEVYVADQLFATLDPTMRKIELHGRGSAIVTDTVGFIRHLPHDLVEAFSATLEETRDASLLLHVVDLSDKNWREHIEQVKIVLDEIEADKVPQLLVFNKIDQVPDLQPHVEQDGDGKPAKVWVSAQSGAGIPLLREAIANSLYGDPVQRSVFLTPQEGKLRGELFKVAQIISERSDEEGNSLLTISIGRADFDRLFPSEEEA